jgi:hypothetical protein
MKCPEYIEKIHIGFAWTGEGRKREKMAPFMLCKIYLNNNKITEKLCSIKLG